RHYTLPDLHLRDLFLLNPLHPGPPPLPYTTLFRSSDELRARSPRVVVGEDAARIRDQLRERAICSALAVWQRAAAQDQALLLPRSEEHTSELQSRFDLVCRLLLEKKNTYIHDIRTLVSVTVLATGHNSIFRRRSSARDGLSSVSIGIALHMRSCWQKSVSLAVKYS